MIENILEKLPEIKKIYLEHYEEGAKAVYLGYLREYFEPKIPSGDWIFFVQQVKKWRGEENIKKVLPEELSDSDIEEIQQGNRKKTIIILKKLLTRYEKNPKAFKNITVQEISLLYKIIQSAEEAMKRTELAKSKLKLDVVKTFFLPYAKYNPEELKLLKAKIDASFQRIFKTGKDDGTGEVGQLGSVAG